MSPLAMPWETRSASRPAPLPLSLISGRWMWSLGDYGELAPILEPTAEAIVERCEPGPGTPLLDVAAGTGNVALLAARRGALAIASDLTGWMIDRTRCEDEFAGAGRSCGREPVRDRGGARWPMRANRRRGASQGRP